MGDKSCNAGHCKINKNKEIFAGGNLSGMVTNLLGNSVLAHSE
jgi:hypothetical protein